ncbi:hypothetical protein EJ05DRAFT_17802 [Pseudovirgaria hyperparasitica]|uniref:Uncharacterized protein n=1 Tax=Pseudovirgaria hyperparasitica TaxID=470096 RepID=A0A6A6WL19_9PEZI|nr:uncharacterized protein EJ05DRAFT_17802 [Pseudovirgaria hyperparasitica]KAF2762862.1 hypothetical protein EJ05DRAFT_17802 [Pseudovirgaria hyperparasitica]
MCWFPLFKSSKRRKKAPSKRESVSEKSAYDDQDDRRRGRRQSHQAQSAHYNTFGAADPLRSHKPHLRVDVPDRVNRHVRVHLPSSSTEMLLNPRPERSRQHRQRHHRSTTTLRGRGAKRDPPVKTKRKPPGQTKKMPSSKSAQKQEWQRIPSPSSASTSTSSRKHRRHHTTTQPQQRQQQQPQPQDYTHYTQPYYETAQYRHYYDQYRQYYQQQQHYYTQYQQTQTPAYTRSHSRTRSNSRPNTSARRAQPTPDTRFAVRAATNTALERIRRDAFTRSPPQAQQPALRRTRATVDTAQTPFHWDCVADASSSARASASVGASGQQRRLRRL